MKPDASAIVTWGMGAIAVSLAFMWAGLHARASGDGNGGIRRFLVALVLQGAWLSGLGALASAGYLAQFDARPPPFALLVVALFAVSLGMGLSSIGRRMADHIPIHVLILTQCFRLPLEMIMHQAAVEGTMPVQMSWSGWNFDVVTGITSLAVAGAAWRGIAPRGLLIAWNAMGWTLLLTIITIAVASTPMFRAFGDDPSRVNTWVAYFPFVWLPGMMVASALFGHVVITRALSSRTVQAGQRP